MREDIQAMAGSDGVSVHTGFPNPALENRGSNQTLALNLNQLVVKHPSSTFLFKVASHNWSDYGVFEGDIAVIDRAVKPEPGDLVIAWDGSGYKILKFRHLSGDEIYWGAITATLHRFKP